MKIFILTLIFLMSKVEASPICVQPTEQELYDQITHATADHKTHFLAYLSLDAQYARLRGILEIKGDIMLGTESCSVTLSRIKTAREEAILDLMTTQSLIMDLKDEYEELTKHPYSAPISISSAPANVTTPPLTFKSPLKLGAFTVKSAGINVKKKRSSESLKKEASQNCLAPITLPDSKNPSLVKINILFK